MTDRDIEAIQTWTHERTHAPTGPRRTQDATCYVCGDPVPPDPRFGLEACCDRPECREAMVRR